MSFTKEGRRIIDPNEYRRAQLAVREVIRERSLRPSDLIDVVERQEDEAIRGAMWKAIQEYPPNDYTDRLVIVKDALRILEEFDVC